MSSLLQDTAQALSAEGALAAVLDAFSPRPSQQALAAAVATAIVQGDVLMAEAGTGTGKTYAYLVPALLSRKRVIVSTGTRALQDQLFHRDLPRVQQALGVRPRSALLKGRGNYLCRYRLEQALVAPQAGTALNELAHVAAWAADSDDGDVAGLAHVSEDDELLPQITSTAENCLGSGCAFWGDCFVVRARQRAQAAEVVVVNHHLLLADLALKQDGFGEILPGAEVFIIDEAHQLPELAGLFFGEGFGSRPVATLIQDCLAEAELGIGLAASIEPAIQRLTGALDALRQAMTSLPQRGSQWRMMTVPAVADGFEMLELALQELLRAIGEVRECSAGLSACHARIEQLLATVQRWLDVPTSPGLFDDALPSVTSGELSHQTVRWYELTPRGFRCQSTPMDVSEPLRTHRLASGAAWVFTSATLTVDGQFGHLAARLGVDDPASLSVPSPFNWPVQALCYLPQGLPDPASEAFVPSLMAVIRPVLQASGGRAFLLFASHRGLKQAAQCLAGSEWPLFVQGSAPRGQLLEQFRASGNGVLLGTASFREGVDVVGDALTVVVIDKLPFASPDDPVFEARLEAIERSGGNAFRQEQLPQAVIALKQGVGRLLRSETDRGVLVLGDRRLLQRSYGKVFFHSLPPFARTHALSDVQAFLGVTASVAGSPSFDGTCTGDLFDELWKS